MGALADLWKSERGLVAVALIAAVTTMFGLGHLTAAAWVDYTKWIFVAYVGGKTITGAVAIAKTPSTSGVNSPDFLERVLDILRSLGVQAPDAEQPPAPAPSSPHEGGTATAAGPGVVA